MTVVGCCFCGRKGHLWDACPETNEDDKDSYFMSTPEAQLHKAMDAMGKVLDSAKIVAETRYVSSLGYYPVSRVALLDLRQAMQDLENSLR